MKVISSWHTFMMNFPLIFLLLISSSLIADNYVNEFSAHLNCDRYKQTVLGLGKDELVESDILVGFIDSKNPKIYNGVSQKYESALMIDKDTMIWEKYKVFLSPDEILVGNILNYYAGECSSFYGEGLSRSTLEGSIYIYSNMKCSLITKETYKRKLRFLLNDYQRKLDKNKL